MLVYIGFVLLIIVIHKSPWVFIGFVPLCIKCSPVGLSRSRVLLHLVRDTHCQTSSGGGARRAGICDQATRSRSTLLLASTNSQWRAPSLMFRTHPSGCSVTEHELSLANTLGFPMYHTIYRFPLTMVKLDLKRSTLRVIVV